MSNNTFSLRRARQGEPFTYGGAEAKFGSISPDGHKFNIWFLDAFGWQEQIFRIPLNTTLLSMAPKKLEVKIWKDKGGFCVSTTEEKDGVIHIMGKTDWTLLKTIQVKL